MLSAVLLDVGATLWPEPIAAADRDDGRLARLQLLLPSVDPHRALEVLKCHMQRASEPLEHDVAGAVRLALVESSLTYPQRRANGYGHDALLTQSLHKPRGLTRLPTPGATTTGAARCFSGYADAQNQEPRVA